MNTRELTEIVKSNKKVIVKFFMEDCNACNILSGVLRPACEKYDVMLVEIDVYQSSELVEYFGLKSTPVTLKYVDGNMVDSFIGSKDNSYIDEFVKTDTKVEEKQESNRRLPYGMG